MVVRCIATGGIAAALLAPTAISSTVTAQSASWIDTSDRAAVLEAYNAEYGKVEPALGWQGDKSSCDAGTTSAAFRQASVDRINFLRRMAGLPPSAVERADLSTKASKASLANSVNDQLSHSIVDGNTCFSADANDGAAKSNIATTNGYRAISLYMEDSSATTVGHRAGLLHPPLMNVGVGDIPADDAGPARNSIYWLDNAFADSPAMRESDGFVAWPPRGFVPPELVYERWSFSVRGANFSNATATVTSGGQPVAVTPVSERSTTNGVPFSIITFDVAGIESSPATDTTYTVTIDGVADAGSYTYDVTIIGGEEAPAQTQTSPEIGPTTVPLPEAMAAATTIAELRAAGGFDAVEDEKVLASYTTIFEREPDLEGAKYWLELRRNGHDPADLVEHMKDSPEYAPKAVPEIYGDVLGRSADPEGLAYWIDIISDGATRAEVAMWIRDSEEFRSINGLKVSFARFAGR